MSNLDVEMAEAIVSLAKENTSLKNELIKECKEHQEAMQVADNRIKELEKQLAGYAIMGNYGARPIFEFPDKIEV